MDLGFIIEENVKSFNDEEFEINSIIYDIAMEEDTTTSVDDTTNKMNFAQKLKARIDRIVKEIFAILDRFSFKIKNTLTRIAQTDVGFRDSIRKAFKQNKPLKGIKLITYQYDNGFLDNQLDNISRVCLGILSNVKNSYAQNDTEGSQNPLDMDDKELYKHILSKSGAPSDVTNLNLYFEFLKKGYRKNKSEQLFVDSKRTEYYYNAIGREKYETVIYEKERILKNQSAIIKKSLNDIITSKDTQNELKNRAIKQYSNASHVYNFYTSAVEIILQLKIEYFLTYRTVLKKLYHI